MIERVSTKLSSADASCQPAGSALPSSGTVVANLKADGEKLPMASAGPATSRAARATRGTERPKAMVAERCRSGGSPSTDADSAVELGPLASLAWGRWLLLAREPSQPAGEFLLHVRPGRLEAIRGPRRVRGAPAQALDEVVERSLRQLLRQRAHLR